MKGINRSVKAEMISTKMMSASLEQGEKKKKDSIGQAAIHPLDPITEDEVSRASRAVRKKLTDKLTVRFNVVDVIEPEKR